MAPFISLMDKGISHFQGELGKLHGGRATPGLLEVIQVDAHAERLPLKSLASVTARSATTLVVIPFNPADVDALATALRTSPLKLQARVEGKEVVVPMPRPSLDGIQAMVKLVSQESEKAKSSIRQARSKAMQQAKACFRASEERQRAEKEIQKLHDTYVADIERLRERKQKELETV